MVMTAQNPEHGWRRTLWSMVAVQFLMSMAVTTMAPVIPLFLPQLGVSAPAAIEMWAGVLNSANFLVSALLAPVWGAVADRYGRKLMVVRASAGVGCVAGLMSLVGGPWQLLALTFLMGAFGGFSSAAVALVAGQVPERRLGYALGWLATAQMVGGLLGPVAGGGLADLAGSNRAVFVATATIAAVALSLALLLVREPPRPPGQARPTSWRQRFDLLARTPGLPALMAVLLMTQIGARSVVPVVTLFVAELTSAAGALATLAGFATSITGLGDVIAAPFLGRRSDVIGYRRVLLICLAGASATTLPMAFATSLPGFLAMRFTLGLFIGGILPTANALIGRSVPAADRGLVLGTAASASLFGAFAGPLLGGAVASALGLRASFVATAALFALTLGWVHRVVHDPRDPAPPG